MKRAIGLIAVVSLAAACTTAMPTPSVAPSRSVEQAPWQPLDLPNADGAFLAGLAATRHDVVIVGGRDMAPVGWASRDGGPWRFEQLGPEAAVPSGAVALGDGIVAVGGSETNRCAHPFATFIWHRDAGGAWTSAAFDPLFCSGDGSTPLVSGARLVMIGAGPGDVPFAWVSDDGLTWASRPIRRDIYPRLSASTGDGFAALGTFGNGGWWFGRSGDGNAWTIIPFVEPSAEEEVVGIGGDARGFIAWFVNPDGAIAAFASPTGEVWQSVAMAGLQGVELRRVIRLGAGYLAFAASPDGHRLFVSPNGVEWRPVQGPLDVGSASYGNLVVSGDRAILLGTAHVGPDMDVTVAWSGAASLFEP